MNGVTENDLDHSEFVEVDPTGRYGRYDEVLGKGASKTVYRAFDEYEGIEVAWNQVKLYDFLQSPEDLERLYCEIHLLKTLKHRNIMKFYTSWVDTANRNINFVTEMFTSGTLRQYRLKHRKVNIRAIKHWCKQILEGLLYLHSHDPPVIHRDLKCDNIFINGNQGEVKIGDLGLAAVLRKASAATCVGTPEFMAPEVYEEEYNELVDIYSFGMCILEMVTFEYPYSECTHPAQIYKKVISGKKPHALYKVEDPEVRRFVEKCLATVSHRLSARELLDDPFLKIDDYAYDLRPAGYRDYEIHPILKQPLLNHHDYPLVNGFYNYPDYECDDLDYDQDEYGINEIDLFRSEEDGHSGDVDITINGRRKEDDGIFLRLRIADKEGRIRNIYFPFDIENDTALSVATEMVAELDITEQDVTKIADMIDGEIASLVPDWKIGVGIEESSNSPNNNFCRTCASNGSLMNYLSSNDTVAKNLQVLQCSKHGCGAIHGRFEEITYQIDGSEQCVTEGAPVAGSSQSDGVHYTDIWAQHDGPELSSHGSIGNHSSDENELFNQSAYCNDEKTMNMSRENESNDGEAHNSNRSIARSLADEYENEIRQELRWLKAKYQMQLRELKDQQLGIVSKSIAPNSDEKENTSDEILLASTPGKEVSDQMCHLTAYFANDAEKRCASHKIRNYEGIFNSCSPEHMVTAKSFFKGSLLPHSLHRATSLPVDATEF